MSQHLPIGDSVPAISVTSPGPSDPTPTSSPATLGALDDSRLTPVPPMPKNSPDQRQASATSSVPRPVPLSVGDHSFPNHTPQFRFFKEATNVRETQSNFSRYGARQTTCRVHSSSPFNEEVRKKDSKRKFNLEDEEDGKSKSKPQRESIPSFSSPWAPSSCSPKRVLWKEVEDYNRQRKRVRFLGWSGVENPWAMEEEEGSSTVCSEGSDCSDADESSGPTRPSSENRTTVAGEEKEGNDWKGEVGNGIKVIITTSKDGTTTTTLEAGLDADLGNGIEIVTKTILRGDEVTTVTTTTLIPLPGMTSRTEPGD